MLPMKSFFTNAFVEIDYFLSIGLPWYSLNLAESLSYYLLLVNGEDFGSLSVSMWYAFRFLKAGNYWFTYYSASKFAGRLL